MLVVLASQIFICLIIIISIFITLVIISIFECNSFKIKKYYINNYKNDSNIRLIFITDYHNKNYKHKEDIIIDSIISTRPNIIVLGGDFINFSKKMKLKNEVEYENSLRFIKKLCKAINISNSNRDNKCSVYFEYGNHELRLKKCSIPELENRYIVFIKFLLENEIKLVEDGTININNHFTLSTLNLFEGYYNKIFNKDTNNQYIDKLIFDKYFKNLDRSKYNIALFHKPDYSIDFIKYGFDLVLSGHYHGGLIKLPIFGILFSPDLTLFPKYSYGLYKIKEKNIIVSSGLGEHFLKIRINNKPEICLINILGNGRN